MTALEKYYAVAVDTPVLGDALVNALKSIYQYTSISKKDQDELEIIARTIAPLVAKEIIGGFIKLSEFLEESKKFVLDALDNVRAQIIVTHFYQFAIEKKIILSIEDSKLIRDVLVTAWIVPNIKILEEAFKK